VAEKNTSAKPGGKPGGKKRLTIIILVALLALAAIGVMRENMRKEAPDEGQMRVQLPGSAQPDNALAVPEDATNSTGNATAQRPPAGEQPAQTGQPAAQPADAHVGVVMPKVDSDSVILPLFIEDLAKYLVSGYYPASASPATEKGGVISLGPKNLNMRYGVDMTGLSWSGDDVRKGRQSVLRYILTPTMADALYRLYVDKFMSAVEAEAKQLVRDVEGEERPLTRREIKEMHLLLAQKVMATAGVLRACAIMEDAMVRVDSLHMATRAAFSANERFQVTLHQYQELADNGGDPASIADAKKAMDTAGKTYQQAIMQRERTKESLANALRKYKWVSMQDDAANIYVAQWVYRRVQDNPRVFPALMTVHERLLDLAERLEKRSAL